MEPEEAENGVNGCPRIPDDRVGGVAGRGARVNRGRKDEKRSRRGENVGHDGETAKREEGASVKPA